MVKRGFTLIELLVVVVIIGLLAAIVYPVFSRVRSKVYGASCQSNLRQIGLGLLQYTQDYDEVLPASVYYKGIDDTTGTSHHWRDSIYPYVKGEGVFNCPGQPFFPWYAKFSYTGIPRTVINTQGSYWCNGTYYNDVVSYGRVSGSCVVTHYHGANKVQRLSAIVNSAETIWASDASGDKRRPFFSFGVGNHTSLVPTLATDVNYPWGTYYLPTNSVANNGVVPWHQEKANVLFCDGHVKALSLSQISQRSPKDQRVLRLWTIQDD